MDDTAVVDPSSPALDGTAPPQVSRHVEVPGVTICFPGPAVLSSTQRPVHGSGGPAVAI
jgi:hypothetical protein